MSDYLSNNPEKTWRSRVKVPLPYSGTRADGMNGVRLKENKSARVTV